MNKNIRNSILAIIFGILITLFSLTLIVRLFVGGFGVIFGLCLTFLGLIYLIISIVNRD